MTNKAMKLLQEKCGVTADGAFGPNTARAIADHYELSPERAAHLLGQASHESGGFKRVKESLYYSSPERIQKVWPTRFRTVQDAEPYARNPEKLAGKVVMTGCFSMKELCSEKPPPPFLVIEPLLRPLLVVVAAASLPRSDEER